jgi:DNA repair and recombination RAD54-like protein
MRRSVLAALSNGLDPSNSPAPASPRFCSGGGFGTPTFKKTFTPPLTAVRASLRTSTLNSRKRKRHTSSEDADDDDGGTPKRKRIDGSDSQILTKSFRPPEMRDSQGGVIVTRLTHGALGVCRRPQVVPRPLHDPFADHAIVLWDPTIDVSEADKKKEEEEEQIRREQEAAKSRGPHKSLAEILGISKIDKKKDAQVPVVIDPRLSAVLRPHQVEGVKFLYKAATGGIAEGATG